MKYPVFLLLLFFPFILQAQTPNPDYDSVLVKKLGGDEYGMKKYVLVILKTGPAGITDKPVLDSLFKGHMSNINRLAKEGKLIVAGPLGKNEQAYRGIFILDVETVEEAEQLVITDPAVAAGVFDVEYFKWYGSAALPVYMETDKKLTRFKWD